MSDMNIMSDISHVVVEFSVRNGNRLFQRVYYAGISVDHILTDVLASNLFGEGSKVKHEPISTDEARRLKLKTYDAAVAAIADGTSHSWYLETRKVS